VSESAQPSAEAEPQLAGQAGGWRQAVAWRPTTAGSSAGAGWSAGEGQPQRTSPLVVVLALGLATVVFGGLAAWFGLQANAAGQANNNSALTDNATTSQVIGQVNNSVNTIFSYKYTNIDDTKKAAQNLLTGKALCQYNNLYKTVQQNAPQQKLILTTQVVNSGVESLQGDLARVLVFADQSDTRTDINQTSYAGAQFAVAAQRVNGQWKISDIDTFSNQAATNAGC
jgi:Mce-associated membrane protein